MSNDADQPEIGYKKDVTSAAAADAVEVEGERRQLDAHDQRQQSVLNLPCVRVFARTQGTGGRDALLASVYLMQTLTPEQLNN